jgi:DNA repair exonuclease SbcCD ATPase subunit
MKLIVKNYEGIKELEENLKYGITQITGETNTGKSSLIRAIWDFANNSATENELSIFTEPKEKMLIQLDEDYFERDKKNKKYFLSGVENNKPGREKVETGLDKANFQMQQEPLFLVGETKGSKYEYIIGKKYDLYIDTITALNKEANVVKKERVFNSNEVDKKYKQLEEVELELEELNKTNYSEKKQKIQELVNKALRIEQFEELKKEEHNCYSRMKTTINEEKINRMNKIKEVLANIEKLKLINVKINNIKIEPIVDTKKMIDKYRVLFNLEKYKKLKSKENDINIKKLIDTSKLERILDILKKSIKIKQLDKLQSSISMKPVIKIEGLIETLKRLKDIETKKEELENKKRCICTTQEKLERTKNNIEKGEKELVELRGTIEICPLCGTDLKGGHEHG